VRYVRLHDTALIPFLLNYHALFGILYRKKAMYQPLPAITEDLETLQARLRSERDAQLRPRLHLLVLLKSGQITTRRQAAVHLAVHRNTVALWLRTYHAGGLPALLTYKEAGAPAGQKTLPPAVFAQLKTRLATPTGFASYLDVQRWLREEFALEVPYKTLHGIVPYQLKAKLKRPRPSQAQKTQPRRRTLSSSARVAWAPSPP
jgi:transposase